MNCTRILLTTAAIVGLVLPDAAADDLKTPVTLTMLGTGTYQGKQAGLWPAGANEPPTAQV
ncbi:MAG: hypothetical protein C0483_11245 [Pirellula sp.]|nr:hypothetical protein [Pirellula sp.]